MWQNRLGWLLILTISVVAVLSLTRSVQSSHSGVSSTAVDVGRFSFMPMNFEFQTTKLSTLVRVDNQTGQAWRLASKPGLQWEWVDVPEAGAKPKP